MIATIIDMGAVFLKPVKAGFDFVGFELLVEACMGFVSFPK